MLNIQVSSLIDRSQSADGIVNIHSACTYARDYDGLDTLRETHLPDGGVLDSAAQREAHDELVEVSGLIIALLLDLTLIITV